MSGGSYDYAYSKLDQLERWVSTLSDMAASCRDWSSSPRGDEKWDDASKSKVPTTIEDRARVLVRAMLLERAAERLRRAVDEVKTLSQLMHDVEWVESGDYGVDDLMKPLEVED